MGSEFGPVAAPADSLRTRNMDDSLMVRSEVVRSLSLPDLGELEDIQALDDALSSSTGSGGNDQPSSSPPVDSDDVEQTKYSTTGGMGYHAVRVFSMGLHRSMSMPKQGEWMTSSSLESEDTFSISSASSSEEEGADVDDFYIPEDDETDDERSDTAKETPQEIHFYPSEVLRTLLPPSGSPAETKRFATRRLERAQAEKPAEEELSTEKSRRSVRDRTRAHNAPPGQQQEQARRQQAADALASFFGQHKSHAGTALQSSPRCIAAFPTTPSKGTIPPPPTPTTPSLASSSSSRYDDKEFVKLQKQDRANSLPTRQPSGIFPRKPSLKKMSSFVGQASNQKTTGDTTSSCCGMKPSVSFSNLSIREYDVSLGDNPSVSFGPPISLGWEYRDAAVVTVDKYEQTRSSLPKRSPRQLLLSYNMRKYLLLKTAGYSKTEIRSAIEEVNRIKRERQVTDMFLPASKLDEVMEGVMDQVKNIFSKEE